MEHNEASPASSAAVPMSTCASPFQVHRGPIVSSQTQENRSTSS
jgi:hypothetical protein